MAWKGRKPANLRGDQQSLAYLKNTIALQLLPMANPSSDNRNYYFSYELNLIQNDNSRFNLVHLGSLIHIQKDTQLIAKKLNLPIWDMCDPIEI